MADLTLYHNPKCSKSRQAKELIDASGVDVEIVQYLKQPPTASELRRIVARLEDLPADLVRKDANFKKLGLNKDDYTTSTSVVALLAEHPELMERPLLVTAERAFIGRPTERVGEFLA